MAGEDTEKEDIRTTANEEKSKTARNKPPQPTKVLPTDRIQFGTQLVMLRGYAAGGEGGKACSNNDIAKIVDMTPQSVSLCNSFFSDVGLITKGGGGYTPSNEVLAYGLAFQWAPNEAAEKLAPIFRKTWFFDALAPKLKFRPLQKTEAIAELADQSSAPPAFKARLSLLIDYLAACGLVTNENDEIGKGRNFSNDRDQSQSEDPAVKDSPDNSRILGDQAGDQANEQKKSSPTNDGIQFHVDIKLTMEEIGKWEPARISAFFAGMAQILAAKQGSKHAGNG